MSIRSTVQQSVCRFDCRLPPSLWPLTYPIGGTNSSHFQGQSKTGRLNVILASSTLLGMPQQWKQKEAPLVFPLFKQIWFGSKVTKKGIGTMMGGLGASTNTTFFDGPLDLISLLQAWLVPDCLVLIFCHLESWHYPSKNVNMLSKIWHPQ
mgnify:CR=1 FL=1